MAFLMQEDKHVHQSTWKIVTGKTAAVLIVTEFLMLIDAFM